MYLIVGIWGSGRKLYAAIKFFLYTLLGSVLLLLGILALYFYHAKVTGLYTFDIRLLQAMGVWPDWFDLQYWIWLAFFVGFAIKVPMFPFHTWLPDAHTEAPTAGSVILAGVLLKMGTYGFIRFSLPMLPDATWYFLPFAVGLSIIGIIYGAMVALVQKDWKRLVAFSSVSHLGFVMLGVFALNFNGLAGGVLQMINHGLSTGALFLIVGLVYERRHTREISEYGGLWKVMPVFAVFFMVMMLSSIGMPAIPGNGFVGEFTILAGAFNRQVMWAVFAVVGIVLGAAYMLWALPAHHVRQARQSEEREAARSQLPRDHDAAAPHRPGLLDRSVPEAVLCDPGGTGPSTGRPGREDPRLPGLRHGPSPGCPNGRRGPTRRERIG